MRSHWFIIALSLSLLFILHSVPVFFSNLPSTGIEKSIVSNAHFNEHTPHNSVNIFTSTDNNIFLPGTNFTVFSFLDGYSQDSFNLSVLSISPSTIFIRCDYSIAEEDGDPAYTSPFYASINRTSTNNTYITSDYFDWNAQKSTVCDFWIDTSNFYVNYLLYTELGEIEVKGKETINMEGVGEFEAWKLNGTNDIGWKFSLWYDSATGVFLCFKSEEPILPLFYNLTKAEFANVPDSYSGPSIIQLSPSNGSSRPNGTKIEISFISPFGIASLYYQWDDLLNHSSSESEFITTFLDTEEIHHLYIRVIDGIDVSKDYHLIYITDNRVPAILLTNLKNNSRIQGSSLIQLSIVSGNGSFIYNWNNSMNSTVMEGSLLSIPEPDQESNISLKIYVMNNDTKAWGEAKFVFQIDNTPPIISIYDLLNGSTIKGTASLRLSVSESGSISYLLNNDSYSSLTIEKDQNYTLKFLNLANGNYILEIFARDEANNTVKTRIYFSIYVSAFNWNWYINGNIPRTINVINASGDLWFRFTIISKSNQFFNLSLVSLDMFPTINTSIQYIVAFLCEKPDDILFISISINLDDSSSIIPLYKVVYWKNDTGIWIDIVTSYSEVTNSWEATYEGFIEYFAVIVTGETTEKKSIIPGGGQIPSFEFITTILSLIVFPSIIRRKKLKSNGQE